MRLNKKNKVTGWLIMMLLILTVGLVTVGCGIKDISKEEISTAAETVSQTEAENKENEGTVEEETDAAEVIVLGEGNTSFPFTVVDNQGSETKFEIHTDKKIVGEALVDVDLISGEEGEFGLYVKVVNGITADYDVDQTYWAFYVDGEYAMSGVDATEIEDGVSYAFKVEK